ncbi:hypothetical protein TPR58_12470 [Sphingomonas sp. HF-S3]|uniref:SMI1/KNR4 family protein n=1 Tax=Sphingomonas rustica TaxID=3103142 RepID=A0ABV0B9U4_9SPHN
MTYTEAVEALVQAGDEAETPIDLETPDADAGFHRTVFGDDLADEIGAAGYPGSAEIPWIVEDLYIYGLDELEEQQAGYRADANSGEPSKDWGEDRYAIADWSANPVSIAGDGSISFAKHGEGRWTHHRIAADLPAFFNMLAAWLNFFIVDRGGNLFDDNFEIAAATREEVRSKVLADADPQVRDAAARFLLGEI